MVQWHISDTSSYAAENTEHYQREYNLSINESEKLHFGIMVGRF